MSILAPGDDHFEDVPHERYGQRLYSVYHDPAVVKKALKFALGAAVLTPLIAVLGPHDYVKAMAFIPGLAVPITLGLALMQYVRSRTTVHIFEAGLIAEGGSGRVAITFEHVTAAKLKVLSRYGSVNFWFTLTSGQMSVDFADGAGAGSPDKQKLSAMLHHIAGRIPPTVKLKGSHNIKR